ncbi:hypothetical protein GCM10011519_06350 [Marmoricola endophyticus]|uniref:SseB protein N-terminal domain-containing protein n=1 Tax=Marmoricola endophyticus TaxID=2040280 RepID=A0A917BDN8_9ACTN|nr:SseB family protein [Marmoricola endophyticus]GGF35587.1 hypothetical protein GCM10011519_06350 [Marmoricola endophyticus]
MREIPDPGFAGDDGEAPATLREALVVQREDPEGGYLPALAALSGARLLVPVVALLGERAEDGSEKSSDMAAVLMQHPDGRTALLAFTGTDAMAAWDPGARPVPVPAATAAASAVQEEADALLVDVAGPAQLLVEGEDLSALASGWRLVRLDGGGWGWLTA